MIEALFVSVVLDETAITALISDRIYPGLPQHPTYPALTYQIIDGPRDYTQDGPDGVTRFRIQCNCYGATDAEAGTLKQTLIEALSGKNNFHSGSPAVKVHGIFIASEQSSYVQELDDTGPRTWRRIVDLYLTASIL